MNTHQRPMKKIVGSCNWLSHTKPINIVQAQLTDILNRCTLPENTCSLHWIWVNWNSMESIVNTSDCCDWDGFMAMTLLLPNSFLLSSGHIAVCGSHCCCCCCRCCCCFDCRFWCRLFKYLHFFAFILTRWVIDNENFVEHCSVLVNVFRISDYSISL